MILELPISLLRHVYIGIQYVGKIYMNFEVFFYFMKIVLLEIILNSELNILDTRGFTINTKL